MRNKFLTCAVSAALSLSVLSACNLGGNDMNDPEGVNYDPVRYAPNDVNGDNNDLRNRTPLLPDRDPADVNLNRDRDFDLNDRNYDRDRNFRGVGDRDRDRDLNPLDINGDDDDLDLDLDVNDRDRNDRNNLDMDIDNGRGPLGR